MKSKIYFLTLILATLSSLSFVSCSKDDDKDNKGKNNPNELAVTGAVAEKGATWADIEGYVNNTDKEGSITTPVEKYGIEYSLADGSGKAVQKLGKGLSENKFTVRITGLKPNTEYQYRTFVLPGATSSEIPETKYGKYNKFTTDKEAEDPDVLDISTGDVTSTGVLFDGLYYDFEGIRATITKADQDITTVSLKKKVKYDGKTYALSSIGENAFASCDKLTSITFTDNITSIGKGAFSGCNSLESIELPSGLKEIQPYTFFYCGKLKTVKFPSSLKSIGEYAFSDCGLTSLYMPNSVETIGKLCFAECNFENIHISESLKEIPLKAFVNCYKLKSVYIPKSVTKLGESAFMYCYDIEEISLPETLVEIGEYCFQDVKELTYLFIPKGVTKIGGAAFNRCSKLAQVTISYGIKSIGSYAFYDTPKNIKMQITASTPPTLGTEAFKELNSYDNQRTLMVPASYLSAYSSNSTYKKYFKTIKASE